MAAWMWAVGAMAVGSAFQLTGIDQQARQEQIRQDEIARQNEENKLLSKLRGEQLATARSREYTKFLKSSSAIAGFNNRADDRSLKAIQRAAQERTGEELQAIRIQSLFAQGRFQSAANMARTEANFAQQNALVSSWSTIADNGYKAAMVFK